MTISRSNVLKPFLHQRPMQRSGPPSGDSQTRASEAAITSQTGGSGPIPGSHNKHMVHTKIGDHRQGIHTGSQNSSAAPRTSPGAPIHNGSNRNGIT